MLKYFIAAVFATLFLFGGSAFGRRLKVYSFPQQIAAGQLATIIFENPNPEKPMARSSCTADKLIAWIKSDVPILRIGQGNKQVFTSLGSYMTQGDSMIATYMVPVAMEAGDATLYLLNDRDASVPYPFTVTAAMHCGITKISADHVAPLGKFTVIGDGFLPAEILSTADAIKELQLNVGYDKMSLADQYTTLHRRMANDWARIAMGDFLELEQGGKKWELFVESCGLADDGLSLDFTAPPDIKPGPATLVMVLRKDKAEAGKSAPLTIAVQ